MRSHHGPENSNGGRLRQDRRSKFLKSQAGYCRARTEDVDSVMERVAATLPSVGGVQRAQALPLCGATPDDAPAGSVDLVACGGRGAAESDGRGCGAV